jgi:hypothetical protein
MLQGGTGWGERGISSWEGDLLLKRMKSHSGLLSLSLVYLNTTLENAIIK